MRILIAEDDPVSCQILERFLTEWGFEAVVTRDGPEAWEVLRGENPPGMAILDWMMPELEGPEVVRRVRALETERRVTNPTYFILLTARETKEDVVLGFEAGADDYVTKPFQKDELQARVRVGARMRILQKALAERVEDLEVALKEVRTLKGLLPICSYCKKIRDDDNYWTDVERYFEKFSAAEFSHGVCPDCYQEHLAPELADLRDHDRPPKGASPASPASSAEQARRHASRQPPSDARKPDTP